MKRLALSVMLVVAVVANTFVCTNLTAGKNVSMGGSTTVSYFVDSYGLFGELYHYPAGMHKKGILIGVHEWDTGKYLGQIEQARQIYNVIGNMNEFQLIIDETTFGGRPELVDIIGITDYESFIYLGLQRSRIAREITKVMTDLVQEYGYYSSGEPFVIADPNEIWTMEMIGKRPGVHGVVWVAVHVPGDCISAHANQSRIRQSDINDKNNRMYSPDVISFVREKGYFGRANKDLSFASAYAPFDFGARRYCEARVWSYFNMFTAHGNKFLPHILDDTDAPMPLFMKSNRKISVQDVGNVTRDRYEDTPPDISRDFDAGPYHIPYRLSPLFFKVGDKEYFNERPISTQQSGFVFAAQMRSTLPDAIGGVLWFDMDDANMTVPTPVYCCTDKVPVCYSRVDGADYIIFSRNSSFRIFNQVSNIAYPRYDLMTDDVRATQTEPEITFNEAQEDIEAVAVEFLEKDPAKAKTFLINYTNMTAQGTLDAWKRLGEFMIVKYNDGAVKRMKDGKLGRNPIEQPAGVVRPGYLEELPEGHVKQTGDRYKMPQ